MTCPGQFAVSSSEMFGDSHIYASIPHAEDSPSADLLPPGQMAVALFISEDEDDRFPKSGGEYEALKASSVQMCSRGLGQDVCVFCTTLLSCVNLKNWKEFAFSVS